ncbi:phosphoserine aminotransferase [Bartonella henselae]|nr:phosphoserine transaminase [Bartonella henselae]MDM9996141.1 phosphoserine transaminase [Bartonella henselae]OLL48560.1 phosphoserine aminotransferase [Bartonella henselae]OLL48889.1 phosphoserine aminotransferase [Bartonella henselae]OLL49982.1 phosphoserine aminotransferase [Bartonella henselae]OLL57536.1 phosphoserine aminotransferase [Bartonella henselae]
MIMLEKPTCRPNNPNFSSGPCSKRPGWTLEVLKNALVGRSHRSREAALRLAEIVDLTREVLEVPSDYRIGIVPASDTGAVEMSLWSLLGERGVDMAAWESFGSGWITDVVEKLKLSDVRRFEAPYGELPDLTQIDFDRDVVFTWNGTTSGVRIPNADFIPERRAGLTICDATSAAFAQNLDFSKLDVVTFSWQKVLGGEAAHGMLILSPRAVERLESYVPTWPMPQIFCLTKDGKLNENIFKGVTINTPSLLCIEDFLDALKWAKAQGGLHALMARVEKNFAVLDAFVRKTPWLEYLAKDPQVRSNTSVCLDIVDPVVTALDTEKRVSFIKAIVNRLDEEEAAYDIGSYRDAPPGLRIWTGITIEASDLEILTSWLEWAFQVEKAQL